MSKTLFVGIDAHSQSNTACFLDQDGNIILKSFSFPNNLPGAQELEIKIISVMQENQFDSLKIAAESTSFYSLHLVEFLAASTALTPYSPLIYNSIPSSPALSRKPIRIKTKPITLMPLSLPIGCASVDYPNHIKLLNLLSLSAA